MDCRLKQQQKPRRDTSPQVGSEQSLFYSSLLWGGGRADSRPLFPSIPHSSRPPSLRPVISVDLKHKIDGFLRRSYRYGFTKEIFHIRTIIDSVTYDLFNKVKASNHCLYHLLPPQRPLHDALRVRGHMSSNYLTAYTNFTSNLHCKFPF